MNILSIQCSIFEEQIYSLYDINPSWTTGQTVFLHRN